MSLTPNSNLKNTPYITTENANELARLDSVIKAIEHFKESEIYALQEMHAEIMREEIQEAAPYDFDEIDDYHMKDHIERRDFDRHDLGKGQEVESEAVYSGHLEYGIAYHGVQHVFFRPSVERGQKEFKADVIKRMTEIIKK